MTDMHTVLQSVREIQGLSNSQQPATAQPQEERLIEINEIATRILRDAGWLPEDAADEV